MSSYLKCCTIALGCYENTRNNGRSSRNRWRGEQHECNPIKRRSWWFLSKATTSLPLPPALCVLSAVFHDGSRRLRAWTILICYGAVMVVSVQQPCKCFEKQFVQHESGSGCSVCDNLWFLFLSTLRRWRVTSSYWASHFPAKTCPTLSCGLHFAKQRCR